MIVYVESNFILELAYLQEEHESCEEILKLARKGRIGLVLPAYSVGESYDSWVRRSKQRVELQERLSRELNEISRSKPYGEMTGKFQEITKILVQSGEEEKDCIRLCFVTSINYLHRRIKVLHYEELKELC